MSKPSTMRIAVSKRFILITIFILTGLPALLFGMYVLSYNVDKQAVIKRYGQPIESGPCQAELRGAGTVPRPALALGPHKSQFGWLGDVQGFDYEITYLHNGEEYFAGGTISPFGQINEKFDGIAPTDPCQSG